MLINSIFVFYNPAGLIMNLSYSAKTWQVIALFDESIRT
jgi:hypothetical protein